MNRINFRIVIKFAFLLFPFFILSLSPLNEAKAQTATRPAHDFDVLNYTIHVNFDRRNKTVIGDTTVNFKPLINNFKSLELDAEDMKFDAVQIESSGASLEYKLSGQKISIVLDKVYNPADDIAVRFKYTAKPKKGVYFVDEYKEKNKVIRSAQIWTQGEAEEAHHWFPSYDFPDDKATSEQFITVEAGETAIGNGNLTETIPNTDGTTVFHYRMPLPHSSYLVSFVIGKYAKNSARYKSVPLDFYVYPGFESIIPRAFGKTGEMLRVFEGVTNIPFPYNKYDQTIVAKFNFGGMENITATTFSEADIIFTLDKGNLVEDLVSHELAHSWFGDLVTCKNWRELWLNEGWATFMEAVYREKMYGREDYLRKIRGDAEIYFAAEAVAKKHHGLYNLSADPDDDDGLFDTTTYQKGGSVIYILRETLGDETFWKGVNDYLNKYKFGNVETADFQKAMEAASGKNLDAFFKQWVYRSGFPSLDVKPVFNADKKILKLNIKQNSSFDDQEKIPYQFPVEFEIQTEKGTISQTIEVNRLEQTEEIKLDNQPNLIVIDKKMKIPLLKTKISAIGKDKTR